MTLHNITSARLETDVLAPMNEVFNVFRDTAGPL